MHVKIFSGGPLSKVVGDSLASQGVPLMQVLGMYAPFFLPSLMTKYTSNCSTEVGCANTFIPEKVDPLGWEYFQFGKQHHIVLAPQKDSPALEFQILVRLPIGQSSRSTMTMHATTDIALRNPHASNTEYQDRRSGWLWDQ